jgi:hypothetical protein
MAPWFSVSSTQADSQEVSNLEGSKTMIKRKKMIRTKTKMEMKRMRSKKTKTVPQR